MYLKPFLHDQDIAGKWEELGAGTPTVLGLALLCSRVLAEGAGEPVELTPEARAILVAARDRGMIEVKAARTAFESPQRILAIHIERAAEQGIVFRHASQPEFTIRFMEGFRQLCQAGLVLHQLYCEFSLSQRGFEVARQLPAADIQELLDQAIEYG